MFKVKSEDKINLALMLQLVISTLLSLLGVYMSTFSLPANWMFENRQATSSYAFTATALGLISGFIIGLSTNYYTSYEFSPV